METDSSSSFISAPNSDSCQLRYEVFLSFRGSDTRTSFISHLYDALWRKGIITFKDDPDLEKGKNISEILKAIRESRISIIVFSRNFARSTWCLDEIVTILDCVETGKHVAVPVFYDVHPDVVAGQTGKYRKAFAKHEVDFEDEVVRRWRYAMTKIAELAGWPLQTRPESDFIKEVVEDVQTKLIRLGHRFSRIAKDFVGLESHFERMSSYLDMKQMEKARFFGITGMGGIGKTTIARFVYEQMYSQFEGGSFVMNVRETCERHGQAGLVMLQEQILYEILRDKNIKLYNTFSGQDEISKRLCSRRVLLVLDDVSELDQLKTLAGMCVWFGNGSMIIITTRDEHVLICHGVDKIYRVQELNYDKSHELLHLRAFANECYNREYSELLKDVVKYASGLPLALDILGSFLRGKSVEEWRDTLKRLKEIPNEKIMEKLRISYDGLEAIEKRIFLDIACFFNGWDKNYVKKILTCCGLHPDIGIKVLIDKSLLMVFGDKIQVHGMLQELGKLIVLQESPEEPGKRSRLWLYEEICHVLLNDTGTEQVEAIVLDSLEQDDKHLNGKAFAKMKNLRLLILRRLHLSKGLNYLSNELRYFEWYGYPFRCFPSSFLPRKLVELHLPSSNIVHLWRRMGTMPLRKLNVMDLSYSKNLTETPNFNMLPNLEKLVLEGCIRLVNVHSSIGTLKRLKFLDLSYCTSLSVLPNSMHKLKSLEVLKFKGCTRLGKPYPSWDVVTHTKKLDVSRSSMALMLPTIHACSLTVLDLSYCNLVDGSLPNDLSCMFELQTLDLSGNNFSRTPTSISGLSKLEVVSFRDCKKLRALPDLPASTEYLDMSGCTSLETFPKPYGTRAYLYREKLNFSFLNCLKLYGTAAAITWFKQYLLYLQENKGYTESVSEFSAVLPGSEIPNWLMPQGVSSRSELKMELPPNWCNAKWMGFAFCIALKNLDNAMVAFDIDGMLADGSLWMQFIHVINMIRTYNQGFTETMRTYNRGFTETMRTYNRGFTITDHFCFGFIPRRSFAKRSLSHQSYNNITGEPDSLKSWNQCNELYVRFQAIRGQFKHLSCRLVYEEDVASLLQ